jgi:3-oxoacyl-[acyl-carrier protein] reductase
VTESGGEAVLCRADVGNPGEVSAMVMHLLKGWDRLDVLICSTGLASGRLLLRLPEPEWLETVRINLTGVFHCLRAVAPHMIDRRRGSIVVIGSYAGFHGRAGQTAYAAAKAGLLGLVRTAAKEWGSFGVRVNLVLPGLHATRLSEGAIPHQGQYADHLLGAPPRLLDIGRTIRDLSLLPAASGQVWNLDSRLL